MVAPSFFCFIYFNLPIVVLTVKLPSQVIHAIIPDISSMVATLSRLTDTARGKSVTAVATIFASIKHHCICVTNNVALSFIRH